MISKVSSSQGHVVDHVLLIHWVPIQRCPRGNYLQNTLKARKQAIFQKGDKTQKEHKEEMSWPSRLMSDSLEPKKHEWWYVEHKLKSWPSQYGFTINGLSQSLSRANTMAHDLSIWCHWVDGDWKSGPKKEEQRGLALVTLSCKSQLDTSSKQE